MESVIGKCRFCGQTQMIEALEGMNQEEIDEEATRGCRCDEARRYLIQVEKEEKRRKIKQHAMENTSDLFHEDRPEIEYLLNESIDFLMQRKIKKITISTGGRTTGSMEMKCGKIKVDRTEKSNYARETELE